MESEATRGGDGGKATARSEKGGVQLYATSEARGETEQNNEEDGNGELDGTVSFFVRLPASGALRALVWLVTWLDWTWRRRRRTAERNGRCQLVGCLGPCLLGLHFKTAKLEVSPDGDCKPRLRGSLVHCQN